MRYGVGPEGLLDHCLVSIRDNEMVGSLSLEFSEGKAFEVEEHLGLERNFLPFRRELTVSFGRWVSLHADVGIALAFAGVKYALQMGKIHCLGCSKPRVVHYLRHKLGLKFHSFHFGRSEKILQAGNEFFATGPMPILYCWHLEDWYDVLKKRIAPGSIAIEL